MNRLVKRKLGFIVNPIAGIGGRVGLKGSDGQEIIEKALELGAFQTSPSRAVEALRRLTPIKDNIELITCPYEMGEDEARECSFQPIAIGSATRGKTTSADTRNAAKEMCELRVDLLLFAGGDGTARDIHEAVDQTVPVLGIPAGVKIHSAVFAVNPRSAGDLALMFLREKETVTREAEVMDVDEQAFRDDRVSASLYGYLRIPYERSLVQNAKSSSAADDYFMVEAIASDIIDNMRDDYIYVIGPGTTTRPIMEKLGLKKTLLGVDVVYRKSLVASDANEGQLLELIDKRKVKVIVTVIGGQGFIFGRGNQQISPQVIRKAGRENIVIVATPSKLASLHGRPLLVDTGDEQLDKVLSGYMNVITGYATRATYKVADQGTPINS